MTVAETSAGVGGCMSGSNDGAVTGGSSAAKQTSSASPSSASDRTLLARELPLVGDEHELLGGLFLLSVGQLTRVPLVP